MNPWDMDSVWVVALIQVCIISFLEGRGPGGPLKVEPIQHWPSGTLAQKRKTFEKFHKENGHTDRLHHIHSNRDEISITLYTIMKCELFFHQKKCK